MHIRERRVQPSFRSSRLNTLLSPASITQTFKQAEARRVEGARNLLAHLALAGDGKKNFQVKFRGGA